MTTLNLKAEAIIVQMLPHLYVNLVLTDIEIAEFTRLSAIPVDAEFDDITLTDFNREGILSQIQAEWKVKWVGITACDSPRLHAMVRINVLSVPANCPLLKTLTAP